jgi:hypothetical protein
VTTGGGSRSGGAGGAHGEAGGAGDRDDDDPQLRAMRAVWLTMRQEDPPGGGLAELLTAARAKAETMQARPTRWQRLLAGMRRPPVLALATVMVLVGGAVLLGRHADRVEVRGEVPGATSPAMDSALQAAPATGERPRAAGPAGLPELGTASEAANATHGDGAGASDPGHVGGSTAAGSTTASLRGGEVAPGRGPEKADSTHGSAGPAETSMKAGSSSGSLASGRGSAAAYKDLAPAPPRPPATDGFAAHDDAPKLQRRGEAFGTQLRGDQPDPGASLAPRSAQPAEPAREHVPASEDDEAASATSKDESTPSSVDDAKQHAGRPEAAVTSSTAPRVNATRPVPSEGGRAHLYQQCESAARRGDCVAVKRIVGRITTTDRGYRARLAKDSAIAKCLTD